MLKQIKLDGELSNYTIDQEGIVSGKRGVVTPIVWSQGRYLMYSFNHKGKKVRRLAHRIVATYCLENTPENIENFVVNHKNGNKFDNRPENLEWVSEKENILHEFTTGLSKGTPYRKIRAYKGDALVGEYPSINQCAKALGLNSGNVHSGLKKRHKVKGYFLVEHV